MRQTRQKRHDKYFGVGTNISLSYSDRRKDLWSVLMSVQAPTCLSLTKESTKYYVVGTSADLPHFDQRNDRWSLFISV